MEWEKLTHREHILKRPDTYIGSHDGIYKIIDEILVNAFDEYMRTSSANRIVVDVNSTTIKVSNSKCIPVVIHPKEKVYIPELIFGHLLTSSNYNDSKERYTGGRNGYGAKLTNIFSKRFTVTTQDPENGFEYTQTWRNNMAVCEKAKIKKYNKKTGWTIIEFEPDTQRLGEFDIEKVKQRCEEISIWGPKVTFNGESIDVTFQEFASRRLGEEVEYAYHKDSNWEVIIARSLEGFQQMSYVNGIATTDGGTHVNHVITTLLKSKKDIKPYQYKQHLYVFVKVLIDKPTFSSQTKTECTSKNFTPLEFKPKFIKDVDSFGIDEIISAHKLKKSDGVKRSKLHGIPKLDDANWAGTSKSDQCTLILTEGDSAKALAISGLSVIGRDRYGVFPLKGKPKNVRDSSVKQLEANVEFSNLKKILGLKQGEVYKNTRSLRYGNVIIMTDADLDGSHIKGLVLNMFHVFWPSLLEIGYVKAMVTPVIKVAGKWFFTEHDYHHTSPKPSGVPKYYKGLGTSTSAEAKEYFRMLDKLLVQFKTDSATDDSMCLAFAKERVSDRKDWLRGYMGLGEDKPHVPYGRLKELTITDFIHKDQVKFSEEDIRRSIPHVMDGLKPSQRKVIHACLKKNLERDMTVAQLAGYIGEHTAYHHGEASLQGTIVGLAQDFVGSNNRNLLVPSGQFGSRLEGGKDHASARYISTRLSPCTKKIFNPSDGPILNWLQEDGKTIEPEHFVPVTPNVLENGCEGIGTGYSTFIPPYNPSDINANILRLLNNEPMVPMVPWYRGFTGKISRKNETTWNLEGIYKENKITELPPGKWIQDYKEYLDGLVESGKIRGYENHSTETKPHFIIDGELDDPKITVTIHTSNMYLMTETGIRKFETPEEILVYFAKNRMKFYKLRKKYLKEKLTEKMNALDTKAKFIQLVIDEKIKIFRQTKKSIEDAMKINGIQECYWDDCLSVKTYMYTIEEIEKLRMQIEEANKELQTVTETSLADMWRNDLLAIDQE